MSDLYDLARDICHEFGNSWTDPRTGETHQPPRVQQEMMMDQAELMQETPEFQAAWATLTETIRKVEALAASQHDLLAACEKSIETIHALHGDVAWEEYQASPEMRQIRAAIAQAKPTEKN